MFIIIILEVTEVVFGVAVDVIGFDGFIIFDFLVVKWTVDFPVVHETEFDSIFGAAVGAIHAHSARGMNSDFAFFAQVHTLSRAFIHAKMAIRAFLFINPNE